MKRREFSKLAGLGALALHSLPAISPARLFAAEATELPGVPLGVCDHALRAMQVTADQLVDYAIRHRLDAVQLNSFRPLETREDDYLRRLREKAAANDIGFYLGAGSISDHSTRFRADYGTGRELLREGIRVAAALGSPIVVCRIGTMEDPIDTIESLGPHILCTSARDVMLWETDDGAIMQWTAIGEGLMDYPLYTKRLPALCPGVPIVVESISNSPRPIPFLTDEFWTGFPNLPASGIADFLKMLRRGEPLELLEPPEGVEQNTFDIKHQQSELKASLDYLRTHCGVGLKA